MNNMNRTKEEIKAYLENRLTLGVETLRAMTLDTDRKPKPRRSAFLVIDKYIRDFNDGKIDPRWVAVPGLRGVGKTTLLAQLFTQLRCDDNHKIYISLDDASRNLGVTIKELLEVYEEMLGMPLEKLTKPVYLFLDEVQYDPTWGIILKTLYDRTQKVFIICTGSSALSIQTNPDVARRVVLTKIFPLSFGEYQLVKRRKYMIRGLGDSIKEALFSSKTAQEVYDGLKSLESSVNSYWSDIDPEEIDRYLKFGTLPFAVALKQEPLIYSQINQTLNSVLNRDVPQLNSFDKETIDKLSQILYTVASYESVNFTSISQTVSLNIKTVISVFEALEKTELLVRIYPYGAHETQVRKPSKYLFMSPAFRAMYYNLVGSTFTYDEYKGKLLEDVMGLYLHRIFSRGDSASITYDSARGGADFIIGSKLTNVKDIVLEAGMGKKDFGQLYNTIEKTKARYGLAVSTNELKADDSRMCVSVPLKFFFLT